MNNDIPWTEPNTDHKPAFKKSWPASTVEIAEAKRSNRSSEPEVVYHRAPADTSEKDKVITEQIRSPIVTRHGRQDGVRPASVETEEGVNRTPQPANIQPVQDPAQVQAQQPVQVLPPPGPVELEFDEEE